MKIANIILSVLILLLAAASAVFSYFLFEKRSQFVTGWAKMAQAINASAAELDKDSGLKPLAEELSVSALSHEAYSSLDQKLPKLAERSKQIVNVRNDLADALRRVGTAVSMKNLADEKAMRGIDTHETGQNAVVNAVRDTVSRRDRMFGYVAALARNQFRQSLSVDKMKNADRSALKPLEDSIAAVNRRKGTYESTLRNIGRMVGAGFDASESGYSRSSGKVVSGVRDLQARIRKTQSELDAAKRTIKNHERTIARRIEEIAMQKNVIAEKNRQISSYKRALGRPADDSGVVPWKDGSDEARSRLVGKVIEVHDKYGYIAVDIGKGSTVVQEIGNRKLEVNAGVKKGLDFIVARGELAGKSDFVARVVIDEVGDFCSTANVAAGSGQIRVGDIVYWAKSK
ncbi:MAG: hypothetical protein IJU70_07945 [Lentisphaeria bacterium]|nr:hypothetical protein [Lentisphaeria bacterium]